MGIQNITAPPLEDVFDIPGLSYIPDFIDAQTEESLIRIIDQQPWITDLKRRVQHYGYKYDYKARNVTPDSRLGDIPTWLMSYCEKLQSTGLFQRLPDQVIINEYQPGQGISPHIDCIPCFGDTIASLSLGSSCVMNFIRNKPEHTCAQLLESRSLILLAQDARYKWKHSIAARKTDKFGNEAIARKRRLSLTFRTILLNT